MFRLNSFSHFESQAKRPWFQQGTDLSPFCNPNLKNTSRVSIIKPDLSRLTPCRVWRDRTEILITCVLFETSCSQISHIAEMYWPTESGRFTVCEFFSLCNKINSWQEKLRPVLAARRTLLSEIHGISVLSNFFLCQAITTHDMCTSVSYALNPCMGSRPFI